MPRTPRNPGSGKAPSNAPARGAGWGGPAKGASTTRLKPRGDAESDRIRTEMHSHAAWTQERRERVADEMRDLYYGVAKDDAEPTPNRIAAADKLLDRIEGKAVQRTDVTSKGERMGYVIEVPPEAPDVETWERQARR